MYEDLIDSIKSMSCQQAERRKKDRSWEAGMRHGEEASEAG